MNEKLKAIHFRGIRPDSLGNYLTGLGLLSVCSQKWPEIRGCWRQGHFILLHPDIKLEKIETFVMNKWKLTDYPTISPTAVKSIWADAQKSDTKNRTSKEVQKIRSACISKHLAFLDSHLVGIRRNVFNPIFGTGGNIGKRNLIKVTKDARDLIKSADDEQKISWLHSTIFDSETSLPKLSSAGTWFVFANRKYNSGQNKKFYREGCLSPFSFLFSLEGALLLVGGVGRRLTAKGRAYAIFPFICNKANPLTENGIGLNRAGEFWAPLWIIPTTIHELRALLKRGSSWIGNKAATAPHEFGVAALGGGVDAGIAGFVPFELKETTSSQVFEAIPRKEVKVRKDHAAYLITELIPWINRLPPEPFDKKQKGKFVGLRGPIEQAIIDLTEKPDDSYRWQTLLLKLADAQRRIDIRTDWRKKSTPVPKLSLKWLDRLWLGDRPEEVEIACALSSIGAETNYPFLANIYGVRIDSSGQPYFPKERPQRAIWHEGELPDLLIAILKRRLVDAKEDDPWLLNASYPLPAYLVEDFLNGVLDEEEICHWLPALSMLDWQDANAIPYQYKAADGLLLLDGFFRPLLTSGLKWGDNAKVKPKVSFALKLIQLLQQGNMEIAVDVACARIRSLGRVTAARPVESQSRNQHLIAGLAIPVHRKDVYLGRDRWLLPEINNRSN